MGLGLQAAGAVASLRNMLMARALAEQKAQQQGFENDLKVRADRRADQTLQQNEDLKRLQIETTAANQKALEADRQLNRGIQLNDSIPAGTEIAPSSEALPYLQAAGADLTHQDPNLASTAYEGVSTLPGGSQPMRGTLRMIQQPAKGERFIKGASAKQQDTQADNERQAASEKRAETTAGETARHNREMERIGLTNASKTPTGTTVIMQGPDGPMLTNRQTGEAKPVIGPDGQPIKLAPTAQQRNTSAQYAKARPILNAISGLSEKINTGQGLAAKAQGAEAMAAAKANLNDDVAEYEAMISGFTPLIARALGHTGVLTEQDVQSVKALFPRPGDSKSLRDRKVARIEQLMGAIEGGGPSAPSAGPDAAADPLGLR